MNQKRQRDNMESIYAPFTPEQVDALNQFQVGASLALMGHPFTCANRSDGNHGSEGGDKGLLIATESGWVCPHCGYTQESAWSAMAKPVSDVEIKKSSSDMASRLMAQGQDVGQFELDRVEKAIEEYQSLRMSRMLSVDQTKKENEKTERIWETTEFMLASLRRRRLQHFGVHVNSAREMVSIDPSWRDLNNEKPKGKVNLEILVQDRPKHIVDLGGPRSIGGVSNPGHEGFGCNAWIVVGSFWDDNGTYLPTGGDRTHWRDIPQTHIDRKVRKFEENLQDGPMLTNEELEGARTLMVDECIVNGNPWDPQDAKATFASHHPQLEEEYQAVIVAEQYADLNKWDVDQAREWAKKWFASSCPEKTANDLRSFLTRRVQRKQISVVDRPLGAPIAHEHRATLEKLSAEAELYEAVRKYAQATGIAFVGGQDDLVKVLQAFQLKATDSGPAQVKPEYQEEVDALISAAQARKHAVDADKCADWTSVKDLLPQGAEFCDWLFPKSELKSEIWILCNEARATASVPGNATHWRYAQALPSQGYSVQAQKYHKEILAQAGLEMPGFLVRNGDQKSE